MAVLEAYSPCPCGSGQKYKWCCQKVEAFAQKSARLQDTGASEPAKAALDEGLAKFPANPWLTIRKALILARQQKTAEAAEILKQLVAKEPGHPGAQNFLVRAILEIDGTVAAAAALQSAFTAVSEENRPALAITAQIVGMLLGEEGHFPAALAHLELSETLAPEEERDPNFRRSRRMIEANASISAWIRNPYPLSPAPGSLPKDQADTYQRALDWANQGLWSSASAAFETLSGSGVAEADRNLGILRLKLAQDTEAVEAFRRFITARPNDPEAVDFEALTQIVAPPQGGELVGHVQLIWTIRDRTGLMKRLTDDPTVAAEGPGPIDENDPESPEVEWFTLLDRPKPADGVRLDVNLVPHVEARVTVGKEIAALDVVDDGRLERLRDRLTELAGPTLPPAHPRTKTLGPVSRLSTALDVEMWMPEGLSREERARVSHAEHARIITEVWPNTGMPYLGGKTPRQAAKAGGATLPLRAALLQFEFSQEFWRSGIDFNALRAELNVPAEPPIDASTVDVETLHLARLAHVPFDKLDDSRLVALFARAHRYALPLALELSAAAVVERPAIFDRGEIDRVTPYADLANLAVSRRASNEEAMGYLTKGRQADKNPLDAVRWDFLEVRLRARTEPPESWVPQLAIIMERYAEDRASSTAVMTNLMEMGLVQMAPSPDDREQMLLDTRPLQAVLAQYGPKITTASGKLGVSASQGNVWTPGGPAGGAGAGKIWTPGASGTGGSPDKPKLIIPGR